MAIGQQAAPAADEIITPMATCQTPPPPGASDQQLIAKGADRRSPWAPKVPDAPWAPKAHEGKVLESDDVAKAAMNEIGGSCAA